MSAKKYPPSPRKAISAGSFCSLPFIRLLQWRQFQEARVTALKLIQIGNSIGVTLPKELLAQLGLQKGDRVYAVETPGARLI